MNRLQKQKNNRTSRPVANSKGFMKADEKRNSYMLKGRLEKKGYDWWWHCFSGINEETGEEKSFFIEYFLMNPALGKNEPIFGQLEENKKGNFHPSYMMVKAGCWGEDARQIHRFFAWDRVQVNRDIFCLSAEDCLACDTKIQGSVSVSMEEAGAHPEYMSDAGEMKWDLKVNHIIPFNVGYGAGKIFRELKAFEMYWHAAGMKTEYNGWVEYMGKRYRVSPKLCFGYADKNWGSDFTTPWVWLSSGDLVSNINGRPLNNSCFDIGGGKPKVFGISLNRKLLSAFCYEGKQYEFNFSKFWTGCFTRFSAHETDREVIWHVRQETRTAVMDVVIHCDKKDMLMIRYESPEGLIRHDRLFNGGTGYGRVKLYEKCREGLLLIDDMDVKHCGCEYGEFDHAGMRY